MANHIISSCLCIKYNCLPPEPSTMVECGVIDKVKKSASRAALSEQNAPCPAVPYKVTHVSSSACQKNSGRRSTVHSLIGNCSEAMALVEAARLHDSTITSGDAEVKKSPLIGRRGTIQFISSSMSATEPGTDLAQQHGRVYTSSLGKCPTGVFVSDRSEEGKPALRDSSSLAQPYRPRSKSTPQALLPEALNANKLDKHCAYCSINLKGMARCLHPYWADIIMCESCSKSIPRCFSCERKAVAHQDTNKSQHPPVELCSNTKICGICSSLGIILSLQDGRSALIEVLEFYREYLGLEFTEHMLRHHNRSKGLDNSQLLFKSESCKAQLQPTSGSLNCTSTSSSAHHTISATNAGSTQSNRSSTMSWGGSRMNGCSATNPGEKLIVIPTDIQSLNGRDAVAYTKYGQCDMRRLRTVTEEMRVVDQIYIVKGLPRVLFSANLCHELLHAYLFLNYFPELTPEVEEGFCNAVAVMFLNYKIDRIETRLNQMNGALSATVEETLNQELDICDFTIRKFYRNEHPAYGEGFRRAMKSVQINGFQQTLQAIWKTGRLSNCAS